MSSFKEEVIIDASDAGLESTLQRASSQVRSTAASWATSLTSAGKRLDAIGAAVDRAGKKLMTFGRSATTYLTLPLVGIGIAAVRSANQFNSAFKQIQTLADPAFIKLAGGIDKVKQKVIDLSNVTGQSLDGLTKGLYFAASAGLRPAQVLQVLQMGAKGAAAGLGDVDTVVRTLTSTLNAYAGTNLTAANVMNIMTQAAKDSVAETSDFATGLGPVISTAAQAGVAVNDLAAAIGQATNVGVPFDRAVTGARYIIQSLVSPSAKAASAMKDIGISQDQVATMLTQPGGLERALQVIFEKTRHMGAAGRAAWAAITGGARGAIIANTLVGKHTADTTQIVKDLGRAALGTATNFDDAYRRITHNNSAFQMQRAWNQLKNALMELGQVIVPIITRDVLPAITSVVKGFENLSPEMQHLVVMGGLALAALGPVMIALGGIVRLAGLGIRGIGGLLRLIGGVGRLAFGTGGAAAETAAGAGLDASATALTGAAGALDGAAAALTAAAEKLALTGGLGGFGGVAGGAAGEVGVGAGEAGLAAEDAALLKYLRGGAVGAGAGAAEVATTETGAGAALRLSEGWIAKEAATEASGLTIRGLLGGGLRIGAGGVIGYMGAKSALHGNPTGILGTAAGGALIGSELGPPGAAIGFGVGALVGTLLNLVHNVKPDKPVPPGFMYFDQGGRPVFKDGTGGVGARHPSTPYTPPTDQGPFAPDTLGYQLQTQGMLDNSPPPPAQKTMSGPGFAAMVQNARQYVVSAFLHGKVSLPELTKALQDGSLANIPGALKGALVGMGAAAMPGLKSAVKGITSAATHAAGAGAAADMANLHSVLHGGVQAITGEMEHMKVHDVLDQQRTRAMTVLRDWGKATPGAMQPILDATTSALHGGVQVVGDQMARWRTTSLDELRNWGKGTTGAVKGAYTQIARAGQELAVKQGGLQRAFDATSTKGHKLADGSRDLETAMERAAVKSGQLAKGTQGAGGEADTASGKFHALRDAVNLVPTQLFIHVGANTDPAYQNVRDFLAWASSQTVHMNMDTSLHGPVSQNALGGIFLHAAGAILTRPTMFRPGHVGGEAGPEGVIPLNGRGARFMAATMREAMRQSGGHGGAPSVVITVHGSVYASDLERRVEDAVDRSYRRKRFV